MMEARKKRGKMADELYLIVIELLNVAFFPRVLKATDDNGG